MPRPLKLLLRFALIVMVGVTSIAVLTSLIVPAVADFPAAASFNSSSKVALPELVEGSTVLDMNGTPIGELVGAENRQIVSLEDISEQLRSTVLAVEDADFYEHDGVSARSIMRALRANSDAGGISQGGSTITQQLVKLSLVGDEQSFTRKLKEASLALQLEQQYCEETTKLDCKNRILEQYLNQVYLGRGAYGVEAAAHTYFGKPAAEVDWAEAAILASLIRSPSAYDPIRHPEVARERREIVVRRMMAEGLVSQAEADLINVAPLPTVARQVRSSTTAQDLSYFERHVRDELLDAEWLAPTRELRRFLIFNGGLKITSTMDPRAQFLAAIASNESPVKAQNPDSMAVVVAVEPSTGAVRAAVGETTVEGKGVVELAAPAVGRSPGSSFKTFTLIAALEEGYGLRSSISAAPAPRSLYDDWNLPRNVRSWPSGCRGGSTTLSRATASSNNCAFVRLQAAVGGEAVVDVAERLGITTMADDAGDIPSLTLGSTTVRPLEMAAAYAAIANDGVFNAAHFVTRVEDRDGNVLYEHEASEEQAITAEVARQATAALSGVVSGGTYKGGALPDRRPAAGKTGTNELDDGGNADVWFVGFTPEIAVAVWIGNPAGTIDLKGGRVQGGTAAGKVWHEFMAPYLEDTPVSDFTPPSSTGRSTAIKDPWGRYASRSDSRSSSSSSSSRRSGGSRSTTTVAGGATSGSGGGAAGSDSGSSGGSTGGGSTSGGSTGGGSTSGGSTGGGAGEGGAGGGGSATSTPG